MNKYYLGVDLGSTTSKAVIIDEKDNIIGRGITNTRANYKVAADIAKLEAIFDARFNILESKLGSEIKDNPDSKKYINELKSVFKYLQFHKRLISLHTQLKQTISDIFENQKGKTISKHIDEIVNVIEPKIKYEFLTGNLGNKNQFFRDIISEKYNEQVEKLDKEFFESLMSVFDKSITPVENEMVEYDFQELVHDSISILNGKYENLKDKKDEDISLHFDAELNLLTGNINSISDSLKEHIEQIAKMEIHIANMVGTGYGRALLPFAEDCIKSEILCHAFGAHAVFPDTRTVLDIGGQDTKAIQVDSNGLVTSFYMNDRCAAGCGRYLGYVADEFNLSLNEMGPLALNAENEVNICSTCTVFAGAEIRELLNVGQQREDILAGLHRAIVIRAMSLIARSGGVRNEFTFTGGVARNQAVLKYIIEMVKDGYGNDIKINIHTDSIFMGALGGAMFARRNIPVKIPSN
ncbi:MAG: benzoyl-CoA reductase subunit A [Ignavibacteriales bacterium CG_4_9_14_3_um_filter_30_11]|nr:MAG: benzoyl-CoA reductase subunit A [Ignavibacteriales bacterium CG_4_9_14_3_um_filter_30_11]